MFSFDIPVLIIDDALTTRNLLKKYLKEIGFKVIFTAENGVDALKTLNSTPVIGLIFCDWNMPEMNGIEFLQAVRKIENFKNTPFIMVTSERSPAKVKEAVENGVSNYIIKPFAKHMITDKLKATHQVITKGKKAA